MNRMIKVKLARLKKKYIHRALQLYDLVLDTDESIKYRYLKNGYDNPNYYFSKDQLGFIHIPKTGGSSLHKMLEEYNNVYFVNLEIHKPISKYCSPSEYGYFTVLRNPLNRVWSFYQMVLRSSDDYPYKKYALQGLARFLEKCWASRNLACRYISGQLTDEPSDKTLQLANANLKSFDTVILFENFKEESTAFLKRFDVTFEELAHERKSNYRKPEISELKLIEKYNEFDVKLYDYWLEERKKIRN
ncbi:MAG: hypothetical protein AAGG68_03010 [Bacteroidota bacterium]